MSKYAVTAGIQTSPVKTVLYGPEGMIRFTLFLVDIKLLDPNSKAKKFRDSFICEKGYSPPFRVGE